MPGAPGRRPILQSSSSSETEGSDSGESERGDDAEPMPKEQDGTYFLQDQGYSQGLFSQEPDEETAAPMDDQASPSNSAAPGTGNASPPASAVLSPAAGHGAAAGTSEQATPHPAAPPPAAPAAAPAAAAVSSAHPKHIRIGSNFAEQAGGGAAGGAFVNPTMAGFLGWVEKPKTEGGAGLTSKSVRRPHPLRAARCLRAADTPPAQMANYRRSIKRMFARPADFNLKHGDDILDPEIDKKIRPSKGNVSAAAATTAATAATLTAATVAVDRPAAGTPPRPFGSWPRSAASGSPRPRRR